MTSYVRTLSGAEKPGAASQRGAALFADNCAACHGADGKGNRDARRAEPDRRDLALRRRPRRSIAETITNARYGVMPAWGQRLDPVTIKMLAAYVHSLGGGEKFVAEAPASDAQVKAEAGAVPAPVKANATPLTT